MSASKSRRRKLVRSVRNTLIGVFGAALLRLLLLTVRKRYLDFGRRGRRPHSSRGLSLVLHRELIGAVGLCSRRGMLAIVSRHGDGEMIARVIASFGMTPVRGSSTRGGTQAMLFLRRENTPTDGSGPNIVLTPDGPRGPCFHVKLSTMYIAARGELPIYPVTTAFSRYYELSTWDRFIVPAPFSRAVTIAGRPLTVPPDASDQELEEFRARVETTLRQQHRDAHAHFEDYYRRSKRFGQLAVVDDPSAPTHQPFEP